MRILPVPMPRSNKTLAQDVFSRSAPNAYEKFISNEKTIRARTI